ncbi:MAG: hypothetical protein AAB489_02880 [Patescibacteria group bacterium]
MSEALSATGSTTKRLPLHPALEDSVSDPRHINTLSNPDADPESRRISILAVAFELLQAGRRQQIFVLLESCLNGEKGVLDEFLKNHSL